MNRGSMVDWLVLAVCVILVAYFVLLVLSGQGW